MLAGMTVIEMPPVPDEGLTIGAAAEASGLSVDTLRYYEKAGLVRQAPERTGSGQRRYFAADLAWLRTLVMLRRTGMPIRDVRRFTELYAVDGSEPQRLAILIEHRERVLTELREVQGHLDAIDHKIDFYKERVNG
jgi:DNA-binding transcriptional MerR regulator